MRKPVTMTALAGLLVAWGPGALAMRCDAAPSIDELQAKLLDLNERAEAIQAKADAEGRELSEDEQAEIDDIFGDFERAEADLKRRERIAAQAERLGTSLGRRSEPDDVADPGDDPDDPPAQPRAQSRQRVEPRPRDRREEGRWGWPSMGTFARSVRMASRNGGHVDPRLVMNAPTTFGTEGVGEDGGFAVPPEFRTAIMEKVMGEASLLSRTDQLTSGSNTFTFPKDETTPWQTSGGIQAFWEGEGQQFSHSKPNLEQTSVRLNKLTALVPVTSELLEDAPGLDSYLRRKAPEKMDFKINDAIINGTGVGQPQGILTSPALITVDAEAGPQTADTVVFANVNKMYARMYAPCRSRAVWLINQDVEPQLNGLQFPGSGTAVPVYLPPGGLSAAPYGTIFGRPVLPTEACQALGDAGDIILADLTSYLSIRKTTGIRAETSIHLWFDYDMTAFRFIFRLGGLPWWTAPITRRYGVSTLSCFVALAARAG